MKIMIVEDEQLILEGLQHIIDWQSLGLEVRHTAQDGAEALSYFRQDPVDIILSDINMPEMDGLTLLREIRSIDKRVRCILLTGYDEFEYAKKAIVLDVEEYILKPVDEELLEATLLKTKDKLIAADLEEKNTIKIGAHFTRDHSTTCISNRNPIPFEEQTVYKLLLQKQVDPVVLYFQDIFTKIEENQLAMDEQLSLYLKIAMFLQEFKKEYFTDTLHQLSNLTNIIEQVYQASDLDMLQAIFISEVNEIMNQLGTKENHLSPVIEQIVKYINNFYYEDMSLKTLAYKYHMNTSYLGQLFQKEVGCSFSKYLSQIKNGKAREMLLNTNMKITDIAEAVGYVDSSYFFRKFKQIYGVSPASIRGMKEY